MYRNVALVGVGQLGLRYLEGLLQSNIQLRLWAVDITHDVRKRTQQLLSRASPRFSITHCESTRDLPRNIDLLILATTATGRVSTLSQALEGRNVRFVILEKLLTQSSAETEEMTRLVANVSDVWVNYPRRLMDWHAVLQEYVCRHTPVHGSVIGSSWGLLTNALHFVDLLEWWTGSFAQEIQPHRDFEWFESKRPGFLEATGTISVKFADGSHLTLKSAPEGRRPSKTQINVHGKDKSLRVSECDGVASGSMLPRPITGSLTFQSRLTGPLVDQIFEDGTCGLPTLEDVIGTHELYITSLLADFRTQLALDGRLRIT